MTAPQIKLIHHSVDRNGAQEYPVTKFPTSRNCFGRYCSFETLLRMHQKDTPTLKYMIARVEDCRGSVDYYDGSKAVEALSLRFFDILHPQDKIRSVVLFTLAETRNNTHRFQQVAHCSSHLAFISTQVVKEYAKTTREKPLLDILNKAINLLEENNQEAALPLLKGLTNSCLEHPQNSADIEVVEVLNHLCNLYYHGQHGVQEDHPLALKLYTKLLMIDKYNAIAYAQAGLIMYESGNAALAENMLKEAIKIEPDLDIAHQTLGRIALDAKRVENALTHLEEANKIKPNQIKTCLLLAEALSSQNSATNHKRANNLVASVLKKEPQNLQALSLAGKIALSENKKEAAFQYLSQAYALDDSDCEIALQLAEVLIALKNFERADALVASALEKDPENADALALKLRLQKL